MSRLGPACYGQDPIDKTLRNYLRLSRGLRCISDEMEEKELKWNRENLLLYEVGALVSLLKNCIFRLYDQSRAKVYYGKGSGDSCDLPECLHLLCQLRNLS